MKREVMDAQPARGPDGDGLPGKGEHPAAIDTTAPSERVEPRTAAGAPRCARVWARAQASVRVLSQATMSARIQMRPHARCATGSGSRPRVTQTPTLLDLTPAISATSFWATRSSFLRF